MKTEDLLNAMSEINEDLICRSSQKRLPSRRLLGTMVACLVLFLALGAVLIALRNTQNNLQVALFYTADRSLDYSFERAAGEALSAYYGDYDLEYSYYKEASSQSHSEQISQAVAKGCDLVLFDGRYEASVALSGALEHPEATFVALGVSEAELQQEVLPHNILCIDYKPEIAGYLAGYTAVKEGYTKLGYFYDAESAYCLAYGSGYLQGIEAAAMEAKLTDELRVRVAHATASPADLQQLSDWYSKGTQMVLACGELSCTVTEKAAESQKGDAILVGRKQSTEDAQAMLKWSISQILDSIINGNKDHSGSLAMPYYTLNDPDGSWGFQNVSEEEFSALRDSLINGSRPCKAEMVKAEEYSIQVLFS